MSQILQSRVISHDEIEEYLELFIKHNRLYKKLFCSGEKCAPLIDKLHYIGHYYEMMKLYGPPYFYETPRFEGIHKQWNTRMSNSNNYSNIPKSISDKCAVKFAYVLAYIDNSITDLQYFKYNTDRLIATGEEITHMGITYKTDYVICTELDEIGRKNSWT